MNKKCTSLLFGVLAMLFAVSMQVKAQKVRPINDKVYYYLSLDTSDVNVGYLSIDANRYPISTFSKSDSSLWRFGYTANTVTAIDGFTGEFYLINKATSDTLAFDRPVSVMDTTVSMINSGVLNTWTDMFISYSLPDCFKAPFSELANHYEYYLTYDNGIIRLSQSLSTLTRLQVTIERNKQIPDAATFYKLKVDTTAAFVADSTFLRADTMTVSRDSLAIDSLRGDLSMWRFDVDTVVNDTTFFKIYNKLTGTMLAFDVPAHDTIAYVKNNGKLNQWRCPFFAEDSCVARFETCDTSTNIKYYLGMTADSVVMLLTDTTVIKSMMFELSENVAPPVVVPPVKYLLDSTQVYKVKYLSGVNEGKYMATVFGNETTVDSVYAHIPDGQFVVSKLNKNSLVNRTKKDINVMDSLFFVKDTTGLYLGLTPTIPDSSHFVFKGSNDTVEIKPITYGNIESLKTKPTLGYDYFVPSDLLSSCYTFKYTISDTLVNRLLGYDADSALTILADGDTARFILEEKNIDYGASAIGSIARIEKHSYLLRSLEDTTLYLSVNGKMEEVSRGDFFIKESNVVGQYFFTANPEFSKLLVDSTNRGSFVSTDTIETSLFSVSSLNRPIEIVEEPDDYTYLTISDLQKGHYTLTAKDGNKLTCNYYNSAVFSEEGKSVMTRAGSYTAADFCLWIDTARGQYNPNKASFYIIKDAEDTTMFNVSGLFLHVMDSTSLPSHDSYVVKANGKEYNCFNFVGGKRFLPNAILLDATTPSVKDSVGFEGKNEDAINEYRFYLQQKSDAEPDVYYLVTENNYGGAPGTRGYLCDTIITLYGNRSEVLYGGPRERAVELTLSSGNPVANEVVKPSIVPEVVDKQLAIVGGSGQITILNATGKRATIFNIVGQQVADRMLGSDNEVITVPRGIAIVKVGNKTQKVIVR